MFVREDDTERLLCKHPLRPSFFGWHRRWGGLLVARQADPARSETATEETSVDIPADDLARIECFIRQ